MLNFLQENWGNIVVLLFVALIVFLAIRRMVLDKKAGIGACGHKCSECAMSSQCSEIKKEEPKNKNIGSICPGDCSQCKYKSSCH
ncbi:MAG: FeoB-associated Cys-rich membrane protein [Eubacterium sp.]|nr:FeoB-associated Cys-rich membrane protein [Eubacterium sp.]